VSKKMLIVAISLSAGQEQTLQEYPRAEETARVDHSVLVHGVYTARH
jgi:hypothetical protein